MHGIQNASEGEPECGIRTLTYWLIKYTFLGSKMRAIFVRWFRVSLGFMDGRGVPFQLEISTNPRTFFFCLSAACEGETVEADCVSSSPEMLLPK